MTIQEARDLCKGGPVSINSEVVYIMLPNDWILTVGASPRATWYASEGATNVLRKSNEWEPIFK